MIGWGEESQRVGTDNIDWEVGQGGCVRTCVNLRGKRETIIFWFRSSRALDAPENFIIKRHQYVQVLEGILFCIQVNEKIISSVIVRKFWQKANKSMGLTVVYKEDTVETTSVWCGLLKLACNVKSATKANAIQEVDQFFREIVIWHQSPQRVTNVNVVQEHRYSNPMWSISSSLIQVHNHEWRVMWDLKRL